MKQVNLPLKPYWELLGGYLKPQKGRVALLVVMLLGSISLQLINPQVVRYFIDTAETGNGLERLLGAAGLFMSIAVVRQFVNIGATYVGENVAWQATNRLRADLALHCLNLDMGFHKSHKPGELIERVDGDVNKLANFFSQLVIQLAGNVLLMVGVLVLLWLADWRVGLSITAVALLGTATLKTLHRRTVPRWQALRQAEAELFGSLEEWLSGTEEIRSSGAVLYVMGRLYQLTRNRWLRMHSAMRMNAFVITLPIGIFTLAYIAAHILGTTLFREGATTIGGVYVIFYYIDVIKDPLWRITREIEDLQRAGASINRIIELRQIRPAMQDGAGVELPAGALAVAFDNVSFHYEDDVDTNILAGLDFSLAPGTVLGLLGRTGSGKSTLTRLLFRFYDPVNGSIRLGDGDGSLVDIRHMQQAELRQRIGMVTQEVQLFHASVRDNLTLFDGAIADEQILQVMAEVGLDGWLATLPEGLDTRLEAAGGLSAGEAQLLAFTRVFLANPGLVILDEASSRLDPATERLIEKAMDKLLAGRTAIIIAHRLATVQRADEIMILENGRILECGPRPELAADPTSRFYRLLQAGLEEAFA